MELPSRKKRRKQKYKQRNKICLLAIIISLNIFLVITKNYALLIFVFPTSLYYILKLFLKKADLKFSPFALLMFFLFELVFHFSFL